SRLPEIHDVLHSAAGPGLGAGALPALGRGDRLGQGPLQGRRRRPGRARPGLAEDPGALLPRPDHRAPAPGDPEKRVIKVVHVVTRLDLGGAQQNTLHTVAQLDPARCSVLLVAGVGGTLDAETKDKAAGARWRAVFLPSLVREINPAQDLLA